MAFLCIEPVKIRRASAVASADALSVWRKRNMPVTHRRRVPSFKVPNRLILDGTLTFSARRMGTVLYSRRNVFGSCRRSLAALAKLAACSVSTARKALDELVAGGYITRCKHFKYSEKQSRLVYDQYTYHCDLRFQGGFTLIPRDLVGHPLKSSAFVLCIYLYLQAGNTTRAFPRLKEICENLNMSKATVCRALKSLGAAGRVYVQHCIGLNRAYRANSYHILPCSGRLQAGSPTQEAAGAVYSDTHPPVCPPHPHTAA